MNWHILIRDRHPFFNVEHAKNPPLPDVRDVYLMQSDGKTGHECIMWGIERPIDIVINLYRWAVLVGIRVVYDWGTTDEKHRRKSGIPELDGVPLPSKFKSKTAPGIFG